MPAGTMRFQFSRYNTTDSISVLRLQVDAKTNAFFTPLFHINNNYDSYFEHESGLPLSLLKKIVQKNMDQVVTILYAQDHHTATLNDSINWAIPDSCHNLFSMFYYLRRNDHQIADTLTFYLDSESVISRATAIFATTELVNSALGTVETYRIDLSFSPVTEVKRLWKTDLLINRLATPNSEMTLWLSTHQDRVPILVEFRQKQYKLELLIKNHYHTVD